MVENFESEDRRLRVTKLDVPQPTWSEDKILHLKTVCYDASHTGIYYKQPLKRITFKESDEALEPRPNLAKVKEKNCNTKAAYMPPLEPDEETTIPNSIYKQPSTLREKSNPASSTARTNVEAVQVTSKSAYNVQWSDSQSKGVEISSSTRLPANESGRAMSKGDSTIRKLPQYVRSLQYPALYNYQTTQAALPGAAGVRGTSVLSDVNLQYALNSGTYLLNLILDQNYTVYVPICMHGTVKTFPVKVPIRQLVAACPALYPHLIATEKRAWKIRTQQASASAAIATMNGVLHNREKNTSTHTNSKKNKCNVHKDKFTTSNQYTKSSKSPSSAQQVNMQSSKAKQVDTISNKLVKLEQNMKKDEYTEDIRDKNKPKKRRRRIELSDEDWSEEGDMEYNSKKRHCTSKGQFGWRDLPPRPRSKRILTKKSPSATRINSSTENTIINASEIKIDVFKTLWNLGTAMYHSVGDIWSGLKIRNGLPLNRQNALQIVKILYVLKRDKMVRNSTNRSFYVRSRYGEAMSFDRSFWQVKDTGRSRRYYQSLLPKAEAKALRKAERLDKARLRALKNQQNTQSHLYSKIRSGRCQEKQPNNVGSTVSVTFPAESQMTAQQKDIPLVVKPARAKFSTSHKMPPGAVETTEEYKNEPLVVCPSLINSSIISSSFCNPPMMNIATVCLKGKPELESMRERAKVIQKMTGASSIKTEDFLIKKTCMQEDTSMSSSNPQVKVRANSVAPGGGIGENGFVKRSNKFLTIKSST